jgi:CRP/FNR family transcriptional regulator, cyclic AMP receptor protein
VAATTTFTEVLTAAERDALLQAGRGRRWNSGEPLIRAGDPASTAIVLLSGVAKVHLTGAGGSEVVLGLVGPGDLLGEIAAVPGAVRSADVTALEPVEGVVVTVERLRAFLVEHHRVTLALLELALARLRVADRRRLESASSESLARVAGRLVELAERFGDAGADGAIELRMPITQDELAAWSGASREATGRALRTLRELALIETRRRHLTVLDLPRLRSHGPRG